MAVRGCLTLLCILLIGLVRADDVVTSPLPAVTETRTSSALEDVTSSPTTQPAVTTGASANMTNATTVTTLPPTTAHNTTNSTTEPPTTTHHNTTNSTTEAPTTAHTNATSIPTTSPTTPPPLPNPTVGNYSVKSDNGSICLLANLGLQFSFKINENTSVQTLNLDPNATVMSGTCGSGGSDSSLLLKSEEITVQFVFTNGSQKFHLHSLMLSVNLGNGSFFHASNSSLSLWEASLGSSYMCKKEQSFNITDDLELHTFELRVQPFDVKNNMFSTAHECAMDDTSLLIPIIVGAALAGLIVIVVIAYVIGRRRTYVGYQTL